MVSIRRERSIATGVAAGLLLLGVGGIGVSQALGSTVVPGMVPDPDNAPTFFADVLPILQANCQVCHQPAGLNLGGMVAPMSFMTYEDTRPWARVIAQAVRDRRMPPWHAAEEFKGKFKDERFLEPEEIQTLIAWAEAGAPAGTEPDGYVVPDIPKDAGGWALGEPDLILKLDEPYHLHDDITDIYVTLKATLTEDMLPEDRWVKSVEYRPGPHVHHILRGMGGLAPGNQPQVYKDGYGQLMQKGPRVVEFDMHYHKQAGHGTASVDQTEVGIRFMSPEEVIRYRTISEMLGIMDFEIPPGAPNHPASRDYTFRNDSYIIGFTPHMHLRGKSATYEITYPDGRQEKLLYVPQYDFSWQHTYTFNDPVFAPAGSKLRMTLTWDNSADNPHNPDPTVAVRYGEPTTDEMAFGFMTYREVEEYNIVAGDPVTEEVQRLFAPRGMQNSVTQ